MKSFSLIEVVIFVALLAVFSTGIVVTTFMLQNSMANEHKIVATQYAQNLAGWIRAQKEANWNDFIAKRGNNYCFKDTSLGSTWPETGLCSGYELGSFYKRWATIGNQADSIEVTITVEWNEGGRIFNVPMHITLTRFE